jgi:hypothetical protein
MLLMLCLAIGLNSWLYSRPVHKLSSPDTNHQVKWVHNSLVITTGEMNPAKQKLPAHIAPFFFKKINIDPAVATGPIVTTSIDIIGLSAYFMLASIVLF